MYVHPDVRTHINVRLEYETVRWIRSDVDHFDVSSHATGLNE
jgi:hypothetical protein